MMPSQMKEDSGSGVDSFAGVEAEHHHSKISQNANLPVEGVGGGSNGDGLGEGDDRCQGGQRLIGSAMQVGGGMRREDQCGEAEANGVSGRPLVEVEQAVQSREEGDASLRPRPEKFDHRDNSLMLHEPEQIDPQANVQRWSVSKGLARDCASSDEGRRIHPADVGSAPAFEQLEHYQSNGVGEEMPESEKEVKQSRVVAAQAELAGPRVAMVLYTEEGLFSEIQAGLSATQLAFLCSAGEEQKNRMLYQCLKYANDDVTQAKKLCRKFCEFRLAEGWDLVISASDLQGPLRSRVHTLTKQRDRWGRVIMTFSPGALDLSEAPIVAYHKMLSYVLQEVLKEDEVPEKGIVLLVDARGVSVSMLKNFKVADYRRGLRMLSGAFPVKIKAIRILHLTRGLSVAINTASAFMSAKIRSRLEIVPDDQAADGTFARNLADLSVVPVELSIGGTWTGSQEYWDKWVFNRVARS